MRPIKIQIEYGKHSAIWKKKILNQTQIEILSSNKQKNSFLYHAYENDIISFPITFPKKKHISSIISEEHIYEKVPVELNIFRKCFNFFF